MTMCPEEIASLQQGITAIVKSQFNHTFLMMAQSDRL